MKYIVSFIIIALITSFVVISWDSSKQQDLIEPFKEKPGFTPLILGSGDISTHAAEWSCAFTADGNEFYYNATNPYNFSCILFIRKTENGWTKPQIAEFSGKYNDNTPFISPDGKRLFFTSRRPVPGRPTAKDANIYYVERIEDGWSEPVLIEHLASEKSESFPYVAANGNLYFSASYDNSLGGSDIYFSEYKNGIYQAAVNMSTAINSEFSEYCPYIAPDESYMIFERINANDGIGGGDFYISKKMEDGEWGNAINLGEPINSDKNDYFMNFSHDRKYLFFSSERNFKTTKMSAFSYEEFAKSRMQPTSGGSNIYWVDAKILDKHLN